MTQYKDIFEWSLHLFGRDLIGFNFWMDTHEWGLGIELHNTPYSNWFAGLGIQILCFELWITFFKKGDRNGTD